MRPQERPQSAEKSSHRAWIVMLLLVSGMVGCAEPESVLIGKREEVREGMRVSELPPAPVDLPINLPASTVNVDWPGSIGTSRPAHAALGAAPSVVWSADIGVGNSRRNRITAFPVIGGGLVYTLDALARVSAVSTDGALVWSLDLAERIGETGEVSGGGLAYSEGTLYVTSGYGLAAALDAETGELLWLQKLGATGGGSPLVRDGYVYMTSGDGRIWALTSDTGRIAWQLRRSSEASTFLGAPAPAFTGSLVVFALGSNELVATFPQSGLVRWSAAAAGQRTGRAVSRIPDVTGGPVVQGDRIYTGTHAGRIMALRAESGERIWTLREGTQDNIWPVGDSLFALSDTNMLLRIDADTGMVVWASELPGYVKDRPGRRGAQYAHYGPILAGGRVVVASSDGNLRFFSPASGELLGETSVPGGAASRPTVANRILYVIGGKGELHAYR